MDATCTKNTIAIESREDAETPFTEKSILSDTLERDKYGIITLDQFNKLIFAAIDDGRYILGNQYSFYMLAASTQREYCYCLQRYAYYLKEYQTSVVAGSPDRSLYTKYKYFHGRLEDLLTVLDLMEKVQLKGDDANMDSPSAVQPSYSSQAFPTEISSAEVKEEMTDIDYQNEVKLRQDRVEYSIEKNRYARNSLALYTFLNLSAVGILLYLCRK